MKNILRQLSSLIAPVVMGFILPYWILGWRLTLASPFQTILGLVIAAIGLTGLVMTVRMFILIGNGTIMPWDPTRKLIVASLYRYVRNPMILSVLLIEVGEAILFGSYGIGLLAVIFFVVNTVYFIFSEEPGLVKRFGNEYIEYKKNVPRWIPRLKPWKPS